MGLNRPVILALAILISSWVGASGQVRGVGTRFSPSIPKGLTLFGDAAGGYNSGGLFLGGGANLNVAYVTLTGEAGRSADDGFVWGSSLAWNLLRGSLESYSVALQIGYGGYDPGNASVSGRTKNLPIGIGIAKEYDQPGFDIEPWIGLRTELVHQTSPDGGSSRDDWGYGLSSGVFVRSTALRRVVGLPNKFGIHVSADILSVPGLNQLVMSGVLGISYGILPMNSLPDHGTFGRRKDEGCSPLDPC